MAVFVNPKKAEGGQFHPPPLCDSSTNVFSRYKLKPCFLVTSKIIMSHIFPENFIVIPRIVQKIRKFCPSILTIFKFFFDFFDISLLQRHQWRHHVTDDVSISYIDIRLGLLKIWTGRGSKWPPRFPEWGIGLVEYSLFFNGCRFLQRNLNLVSVKSIYFILSISRKEMFL